MPCTHPLTPLHPNFVPTQTSTHLPPRHPSFHLAFTSSQTPSHLVSSSHHLNLSSVTPISSPSPPPLPSSSYPHSQTAPQPGISLSFLWICLLIFRREPPPFHTCRSQPGLAVAPAFSRVARTLCWWEEDKAQAGLEAKPGKACTRRGGTSGVSPTEDRGPRRFQATYGLQTGGRKEGVLALHPRSGLGKSRQWVILLAGPFSLPEGSSEFCAHGDHALSAPFYKAYWQETCLKRVHLDGNSTGEGT